MDKSNAHYLSNCDLNNADMAFFPMTPLVIVDSLYEIPEAARNQKIIGVAELPPVVLHRIHLRWQNGRTFTPKNIPLEFSFFNFDQRLSNSAIYDTWDSIIFHLQKNGFPAIWIVTPQYVCDLLIPKCIAGQGMFYYHNPTNVSKPKYSLITQSDKVHTYPLSEKNILCLS